VTNIGQTSRSPVDSSGSLHELLVDEEAAERGEVRVSSRDDLIDLGLRVAAARPEVLDQPSQDRQSLFALDRDPRQAPPVIDEVLEHPRVVLV
jgi:hypothetical protein